MPPKKNSFIWRTCDEVSLIEFYEGHDFLWNVKHVDYKNKVLREKTLSFFAQQLGEQFTVDIVGKKIQVLRDYFIKENKKVKTKKTGDSADTTYTSLWEHYDRLQLLQDVINPTPSVSNLQEEIPTPSTSSAEQPSHKEDSSSEPEIDVEEEDPTPDTIPVPASVPDPPTFGRRKRRSDPLLTSKEKCLKAIIQTAEELRLPKSSEADVDPNVSFGKYIASELNLLSKIDQEHAKTCIQQTISKFKIRALEATIILRGPTLVSSADFTPLNHMTGSPLATMTQPGNQNLSYSQYSATTPLTHNTRSRLATPAPPIYHPRASTPLTHHTNSGSCPSVSFDRPWQC